MKEAAKKIEELNMQEIQSLMEGATLALDLTDSTFDLTRDGIIVQRLEKENLKVLNEDSLTVALDPEITDELKQEGIVRDLVRYVQNMRKEADLDVTDRIRLRLFGEKDLKSAVTSFEDYLLSETLAVNWEWEKPDAGHEVECGEENCFVSLEKA